MARTKRRKPVRFFLLKYVLPPIATTCYRILGWTWRYEEVRKEVMQKALQDEQPVVGAFLHARTFQFLHFNSRPDKGKWVLMCSKSRDGELMSQVESRLGYKVVRGSSGDGGARALVSMIQTVKKDPTWNSCLAVDGSRGPRGIAQAGIITLAQKTGSRLIPCAASARSSFVYRWSWDRTVFPLPFSKVFVVYGEPIEVPRRASADELEAIRVRLEESLLELHREADELSGFRDSAPLRLQPA